MVLMESVGITLIQGTTFLYLKEYFQCSETGCGFVQVKSIFLSFLNIFDIEVPFRLYFHTFHQGWIDF